MKSKATLLRGMSGRVTPGGRLTVATLLTLAALHCAWGMGRSFPFRDRKSLADAVIGTDEMPPPLACFVVAALLVIGAALVADVVPLPRRLRTTAVTAMTGILGARSALGFFGATSIVSPGSNSSTFRRLDRRIYSPLTFAVAVGAFRTRKRRRK